MSQLLKLKNRWIDLDQVRSISERVGGCLDVQFVGATGVLALGPEESRLLRGHLESLEEWDEDDVVTLRPQARATAS